MHIKNILLISRHFNIPPEISKIINDYIIQHYATIITHSWFNYIYIHNTNLCNLINRLTLHKYKYLDNNEFFYYNINDAKVQYTFSICSKLIKPNISSQEWWYKIIVYALNGFLFIHDNYYDPVIYKTHQNILNIHYSFMSSKYKLIYH